MGFFAKLLQLCTCSRVDRTSPPTVASDMRRMAEADAYRDQEQAQEQAQAQRASTFDRMLAFGFPPPDPPGRGGELVDRANPKGACIATQGD